MGIADKIRKKKNWKLIQGKIDKDVAEQAIAKAKADGVTVTAVVEACLREYIAEPKKVARK